MTHHRRLSNRSSDSREFMGQEMTPEQSKKLKVGIAFASMVTRQIAARSPRLRRSTSRRVELAEPIRVKRK
jgi:hypothetical protein